MSARVLHTNNENGSRSPGRMMAAVMLSTALSTLGGAGVETAQASQFHQAPIQAVSDMGRYCTSCWRNARLPSDAWGDCTQEVFCRLLERVPTTRWALALKGEGDERREFLRAIDAVKKRTQRARRHGDGIESAADPRTVGQTILAEEREAVRLASENLLTPRQQRILQMSFEGWSVQEISEELALPVERISDEKYKAIRKLRAELAEKREQG